jgi:hypothetical protein
VYLADALTLVVDPAPLGDVDADGDADEMDSCKARDQVPHNGTPMCQTADFDDDNDVDISDFGIYQRCFSGTNVPANPACVQ